MEAAEDVDGVEADALGVEVDAAEVDDGEGPLTDVEAAAVADLAGSGLAFGLRPGFARSGRTHCFVGFAKTTPADDDFSLTDDMSVGSPRRRFCGWVILGGAVG
jgi:hypothetical protein